MYLLLGNEIHDIDYKSSNTNVLFVDIQLRYSEKRDHCLVSICLTIHGLDCVNVKCNIRVKCLLFILILEKPLKKICIIKVQNISEYKNIYTNEIAVSSSIILNLLFNQLS